MDARAEPAGLVPLARGRYDSFMTVLEALVGLDSGTLNTPGVTRMADACAARLATGGWEVERVPGGEVDGLGEIGGYVIGRRRGNRPADAGGRRILLMAHMDTVFDAGAATERPFRTEGDRAYGPGVIDDKSGLLTGIEAVELLCDDAGFDDFAEITLLCNPDEEVGSPLSRPLITKLAGEADVALGLEAARRNGDVVSARKGMTFAVIDITGKASHAGVAPDLGVNAALEAAHKTVALQALNGRWDGVTCNVGMISAGSRPNVIASRARLEIDLRGVTVASFDEAMAAVEAIAATSFVTGTSSVCRRLNSHVPWERSDGTARLVASAAGVGRALGLSVGEQSTGGCGDANIANLTGTATLDGLGPIGGGAHGLDEWLELDSIVPRTALLAGFLARQGGPPGDWD
jgi:glutamate carboxypeptidase